MRFPGNFVEYCLTRPPGVGTLHSEMHLFSRESETPAVEERYPPSSSFRCPLEPRGAIPFGLSIDDRPCRNLHSGLLGCPGTRLSLSLPSLSRFSSNQCPREVNARSPWSVHLVFSIKYAHTCVWIDILLSDCMCVGQGRFS